MLPRSNLHDCVVRPSHDGLLVVAPGHRVHQLNALCGIVLQAADGNRDLAALQAFAQQQLGRNVSGHEVAEALDRLADAGLLVARVAPPAGVSRRGMLQRLTGGAALAALLTVVGRPETAAAASGEMCGEEKALIDEVTWLLAEQEGVADLLDDWVEAGWEAEKPDTYYLEQLKISEMERKKKASAYDDRLDDLSGDLSACKFEQTAAGLKKADEMRVKANAAQRKKIEAQRKKAEEKEAKKEDQIKQVAERKIAAEDKQKEHLRKSNLSEQKLQDKMAEQQKKKAQLDDQLAKRAGQEAEHKQQQQQLYKERLTGNITREQQLKKEQHDRLVSAETRTKDWADAYASRKAEQAAKADGATDRYLELAQEESMKAMERAKLSEQKAKQAPSSEEKEKSYSYEKAKEQEQKKAEAQAEEAKKVQY